MKLQENAIAIKGFHLEWQKKTFWNLLFTNSSHAVIQNGREVMILLKYDLSPSATVVLCKKKKIVLHKTQQKHIAC